MAGANIWGAIITGVLSAAASNQARKDKRDQGDALQDMYRDRMNFEREKMARHQNSMGARMAPYLMEQMLNVYGQQSKGRGGFTLPIDEILKNMHIEERQAGTGQYGGGYTPYDSPEYDLANDWAEKRRTAWERNMPTDLGMGEDQIDRPHKGGQLLGLPSAGDSEMEMFTRANATPRGVWREDTDNLDSLRGEMDEALHHQPDEGGVPFSDIAKYVGKAAKGAFWPFGGDSGSGGDEESSRAYAQYNENIMKMMKMMMQMNNMGDQIRGAAGVLSPLGGYR